MNITSEKIKRKLWALVVKQARKTPFYPCIYRSYWHYLLHKNKQTENLTCYYSARPNPGAGIGHQLANWIAGYWFAKQFGLKFFHIPFSSSQWDEFLNFREGEKTIDELRKDGYKTRKLPTFNESEESQVELSRRIIQSYAGKKIAFIAEQDQFYHDQYGVMADIQHKFYSAPCRLSEHLKYSQDNFNIAIHVRRGDIMTNPSNPNLAMRYMSNDYFEKVLRQVMDNIHAKKPVHIYFFSQGKPEDYPEFSDIPNLHWCLDMGAQESFLYMVFADILITSKSSFSYKPALLNRNLKVCPRDFWHGYPDTPDWILVENDGTFDTKLLSCIK